DLDQHVVTSSRDEIGETIAAFGRMVAYLREMAATADRVAVGDLGVEVEPKSERDVLGTAIKAMVANLRDLGDRHTHAAGSVSTSSRAMASTSEEAGRAVGEIANAVADVARGAERQVRMVEQARGSADEAGAVAAHAGTLAGDGLAAVEQADRSMHE